MNEPVVYLSGQWVAERDAKISIFDSAVMLGDTVTESTRTFGHQPFKLQRHIARLFRSLKVTRIDPGLSPADVEAITSELISRNIAHYAAHDDFWIVHNISRGRSVAGADPTRQAGAATVMFFTQRLDLTSWARFYHEGCHAVTAMSRVTPSQSLDPRVKNRSRMPYTLGEIEVKLVDPQAQGVLLDIHGHVAENKGGNIFIVREGELFTPSTANCLAGESRQTVLELARELGLPNHETVLLPYDLYTADELFLTSTPYCIMPATRFNGLLVGDGSVGPVARRLLQHWSERVGVDIVAQATRQLEQQSAG